MMAVSRRQSWLHRWLSWALLASFVTLVATVKHGDFKRCEQSGFCQRNRQYADTAHAQASAWKSPYRIDTTSLAIKDGSLQATVLKTIPQADPVRFPLVISFLDSGVARIQLDEEKRTKGDIELRHGSRANKKRYDEAPNWVIVGGLQAGKSKNAESDQQQTTIQYGPDFKFEARISHDPFSIEFVRDGETQIRFNGNGLLNLEHWRPKREKPATETSSAESSEGSEPSEAPGLGNDEESNWWDETFGGNTDTKPRGPESLAVDIEFPGYSHVFGIPEHTGPLSLRQTRGGEGNFDQPYRLYNLDVFEYELEQPMSLYGAIPFMQAHRPGSTVGVFWLNAAETWIDIVKSKSRLNPAALIGKAPVDTETHWISESGVLDLFIFLGPSSADVIRKYGELTGTTQLPPQFAIGHHQCRWNYVSDEDVKDVDAKLDRHNIPYDVIWLDIEYTNNKKYFTWDPEAFANPLDMQKQLDEHQRRLVIIIDPHIKNEGGYHVSDQIQSKGLAVTDKDKAIYQGWCWPGNSHWVDCFNPGALTWWKSLFTFANFAGTSSNVQLWNDMNEPSVFNGPETTMPKDNIHFGDWEHRDVHNINGLTFHNATYEALLDRDKGEKRPFVLTRSFFSGSQRTSAMWTGDNQVDWKYLAASLPMVLAQNIAGFPFAGADVPGFFGNPSKELQTRWYQAGAFYPFFRAHAHIDTRRREPYLAPEPHRSIMTNALRLRYALMPVWYTAFHAASLNATPIIQPNFYVHPNDEQGFAIDDQYYIGDSGLLVKPVTAEGAEMVDVYLADDEPYYDYFDYGIVAGGQKRHTIAAPLDKIPLLMRGGHVFARQDRPRRSSGLMAYDPYTLVVVLDRDGGARGTLYADDGESFAYRAGAFLHREFIFDAQAQQLRSRDLATSGKKTKDFLRDRARVLVEKIIVVAAPQAWSDKTEVTVHGDGASESKVPLSWHAAHDGKAAWAVVKRPGVSIAKDWTIDFTG